MIVLTNTAFIKQKRGHTLITFKLVIIMHITAPGNLRVAADCLTGIESKCAREKG